MSFQTILLVILLAGGNAIDAGRQQTVEEWEKATFEKQPPEIVMDVAGISNVEIILGEVDDPLFPRAALDMAFMVWTYHYFEQPVAMLKRLRPVLKPGATVVLVEPDPVRGPGGSDHGVSVQRMEKEAREAGFELIRTETILPEDLIFVLNVRKQ